MDLVRSWAFSLMLNLSKLYERLNGPASLPHQSALGSRPSNRQVFLNFRSLLPFFLVGKHNKEGGNFRSLLSSILILFFFYSFDSLAKCNCVIYGYRSLLAPLHKPSDAAVGVSISRRGRRSKSKRDRSGRSGYPFNSAPS